MLTEALQDDVLVVDETINSGLALWQRAKQVIPGGNGLLSKRPERYAPDLWPTYYSKASGVEVTDLDGKTYIDMAQMGIGAAILGYCQPDVDAAVIDAIRHGVSTTLNCPEEVWLAEKLLALNPFAGGVKFARTGGEAMAIAVRIARAFTGKSAIAFSGYHGWSDWYLATNLGSAQGLNEHLLPGLEPKGVPESLAGTIFPFAYNNIHELETLVKQHAIGIIVIEGARYDFPTPEFIAGLQRIASQYDCLIVVDEITSGWRLNDGGVYKLNGLRPDIVVFGKAMGNGYAISAVVGKKEVMDEAQATFISSTFWTERIGFVAALKTLEILVNNKVWNHLQWIGDKIGQGWAALAQKHELKLSVTDFKPLISFKLNYGQLNAPILTLFIQEMLKRGYLAASSVYVSYAHTEAIVDQYLAHVDEVFSLIKHALLHDTLFDLLETAVKDDGFKRLN